jgi:hypothetical protein
MILATSNKAKQVLCVNYIGRVRPTELKQGREDLKILLTDLHPGFRFMANLTALESMGLDCRTELGRNMDLISQCGVGRVVRIIPDPTKDPGLNILGFFHYPNHPQIITCTTLAEAVEKLLADLPPGVAQRTVKKGATEPDKV